MLAPPKKAFSLVVKVCPQGSNEGGVILSPLGKRDAKGRPRHAAVFPQKGGALRSGECKIGAHIAPLVLVCLYF